jgi:hypothetical protein
VKAAVLLGAVIGWVLRGHAPELQETFLPCPICAERRRADMRRHPSAKPRIVPEQQVKR